jgi:hypothetical protein
MGYFPAIFDTRHHTNINSSVIQHINNTPQVTSLRPLVQRIHDLSIFQTENTFQHETRRPHFFLFSHMCEMTRLTQPLHIATQYQTKPRKVRLRQRFWASWWDFQWILGGFESNFCFRFLNDSKNLGKVPDVGISLDVNKPRIINRKDTATQIGGKSQKI